MISENLWPLAPLEPAAVPAADPAPATGDLQGTVEPRPMTPADAAAPADAPAIDSSLEPPPPPDAGGAKIEYASRFTRVETVDDLVAEDYDALCEAVRSGLWSDVFAEPVAEPSQVGSFFSESGAQAGSFFSEIGQTTATLGATVKSSSFATGIGAAVGGAVDNVGSLAKDLIGPTAQEVEAGVAAFLVETGAGDSTVAAGICSAMSKHGAPRAEWETTLRSMPPETLRELVSSVVSQQQEAAEKAALEPVVLAPDPGTQSMSGGSIPHLEAAAGKCSADLSTVGMFY